jgi:hypothetical protein
MAYLIFAFKKLQIKHNGIYNLKMEVNFTVPKLSNFTSTNPPAHPRTNTHIHMRHTNEIHHIRSGSFPVAFCSAQMGLHNIIVASLILGILSVTVYLIHVPKTHG